LVQQSSQDGLSDGPYKRQVLQQMTDYLFPKLGQRPINEIKQKEIVEALSDTWKTKKETGRKLRGNIDRIFEWAVGQELLELNPTPSSRMMPKVAHNVQAHGLPALRTRGRVLAMAIR
jgi:hypothetical protein